MRGAWALWLLATALPAYADTTPHKEGQYGGVTPGDPPTEKRSEKPKRPPPKGTLTWIGFEAKNGGAEVFFQSVAPFTLAQHVEGGALVVHLSLSKLGPNTWRQVDTRFFDNPLSGIVARAVGATRATKTRAARGAGIEARIAFKNAKDAREGSVRTATEADGMYYAYLAFPEGTEPADGAKAKPAPKTMGDPEEDDAPKPPKPAASKPAKQASDDEKPAERRE